MLNIVIILHYHFDLRFYKICVAEKDLVICSSTGAGDVEAYWEQQSEFIGGYTKALLLWKTIEPLYQKLHAFVSKQLSRHYVFLRSTNDTVIPVHILGRFCTSCAGG